MTAFTNYFENKLIDTIFRGQSLAIGSATLSWSSAPTLYIGLLTAAASDSSSGTEATGGSYARQGIAASLANFAGTQAAGSTVASSGTGGTTSNNNDINFTGMPACTLVGYGIYDASSGGNQLIYTTLTGQPITVIAGATVKFSAGTLTVQVDN